MPADKRYGYDSESEFPRRPVHDNTAFSQSHEIILNKEIISRHQIRAAHQVSDLKKGSSSRATLIEAMIIITGR